MKSKIICFGEVLWDLLPTGKLAGGAPMNVAYHANALGLKADIISRIGTDTLGAELLDFLVKKGISTTLIQHDTTHKTGVVNVTLDAQGSPTYEIVMPTAWDFIENTEGVVNAVSIADMLVYGSLVCRNDVSKNTLFELLKIAKTKVFDVNLRMPFYDKSLIESLLSQADIVKMNEVELVTISGWFNDETEFERQIQKLYEQFNLDTLIVSHGSEGAYCFEKGQLYFQPSFKITVQDTIGSGDAFLAAFLTEKMEGKDPQKCLITACKAGAYVATQAGATPLINQKILRGMSYLSN
ncbi:MAG: carbohydrate kinase [Saprospiraceae bacterium]|nr:carbohydrate kinase [Saprospiraceae bacterium]